MSKITLELLTNHNDYTNQRYIELPLVNHVQKRLERFVYLDHVDSQAIPLDYIESPAIDSAYNVAIVNRGYQVSANASFISDQYQHIDTIQGVSYTTPYSNVLMTNVSFYDQNSEEHPLFWKHTLPTNTVNVKVEVIENGNMLSEGEGYKLDLDSLSIYTNYFNFFDESTGAYRLYFITSTDSSGTQTKTLLNPVPVIEEASWEDIDPETGDLFDGRSLYTKERNTSGYTFYFNVAGKYWIRPISTSLIECRGPIGRTASNAWYLRVTQADITTITNGATRRYWMPEFFTQPYQPSYPYIYSSYGDAIYVNEKVISATRGSLAISPTDGRNLSIYIYDFSGTLLAVWTTNSSLHGKRYSNTKILYDSTKIIGWDNQSGLIFLSDSLLPSWDFYAEYYYKADDLEITGIDLNPIQNRDLLHQSIVLYLVPNTSSTEKAVQYLILDKDGTIIYTSQKKSISYPNLQLLNADNSYNNNTVIGMKYISELTSDTFINNYCVGFDNQYAYMIIAEVSVINLVTLDDANVYDVRRQGYSFANPTASYLKNPKALYSDLGYGEVGQRIPNNAVVAQLPLDLLTEYGGVLEREQASQYAKRYLPAGVYCIIEWIFPYTSFEVDNTIEKKITISCTWEGSRYNYCIYRRFADLEEWQLIEEGKPAPKELFLFSEVFENSGDLVYYQVRLKDAYEYPSYFTVSARIS